MIPKTKKQLMEQMKKAGVKLPHGYQIDKRKPVKKSSKKK